MPYTKTYITEQKDFNVPVNYFFLLILVKTEISTKYLCFYTHRVRKVKKELSKESHNTMKMYRNTLSKYTHQDDTYK